MTMADEEPMDDASKAKAQAKIDALDIDALRLLAMALLKEISAMAQREAAGECCETARTVNFMREHRAEAARISGEAIIVPAVIDVVAQTLSMERKFGMPAAAIVEMARRDNQERGTSPHVKGD